MKQFLVPLVGLALLVGCSQGGDTPSGGGSGTVTDPAGGGAATSPQPGGDTVVFHVGMA